MNNRAKHAEASKLVDALEQRSKHYPLTVQAETISPQMAQIILDRMGKNRPLSSAKRSQYLSDMAAGRWKNSSIIRFGVDGKLKDGQHRMDATSNMGSPSNSRL